MMPCSPQAAYLQRAGLRTAVLEKRHVLGGAAVTEEIVPGTPVWPLSPHPWPALRMGTPHCHTTFRLQVLPGIVPAQPAAATDLHRPGAAGTGIHPSLATGTSWHTDRVSPLPGCPHSVGPAIPVLQRHGLRVLPRDPYSFTPLLEDRSPPRSLLLGNNRAQTQQQIAQFSQKDAQVLCGGRHPVWQSPQRGCPAHGAAGYPSHPPWCSPYSPPLSPFRLTLNMRRSWRV